MTPRATRHLLPTFLAGLLVAACTATAAIPIEPISTDPPRVADVPVVAPTADVVLPAASLGPTLPPTGATGSTEPAIHLSAWAPVPPSLDRLTWPGTVTVSDREARRQARLARLDPPAVLEGAFEMDLYRKRDFVTEATKWFCVPAAMLTMINIMSKGADHSAATQKTLYRLARRLSTKTLVGKGAEPIGWARGLEQLGYGGFEVGVHPTRQAAVQAAAKAIRMTGRPAGLLAWRGAHSWVMSGFKATADPGVTKDYEVTGVYIEDVWYPYVSSIWGKSEPPDTLYPVGDLKKDYLKWRRPTRRYPTMDGRFVTILPVDRE